MIPKNKGFTIIELMVATAVFTVVLIAALTGFLQLGRVFYKGTSQVTTQDTAKQILNDVSASVQSAETISVSSPYGSAGNRYICIGSVRYSYKIGQIVDTANTTSLQDGNGIGLVKDSLPGANACAPPCPISLAIPCPSGSIRWTKPLELLGDNMRLIDFSISPNTLSADYFTINVHVAYGEDEVLELADPADPKSYRCKGNLSTQQFCSVVKYSTSLKRGMNF